MGLVCFGPIQHTRQLNEVHLFGLGFLVKTVSDGGFKLSAPESLGQYLLKDFLTNIMPTEKAIWVASDDEENIAELICLLGQYNDEFMLVFDQEGKEGLTFPENVIDASEVWQSRSTLRDVADSSAMLDTHQSLGLFVATHGQDGLERLLKDFRLVLFKPPPIEDYFSLSFLKERARSADKMGTSGQ